MTGAQTVTAAGARVASVSGGDKRNAIAREAWAVVVLPAGAEAGARAVVAARAGELTAEYGSLEKVGVWL